MLGAGAPKKYSTTIALIVESGSIYCAAIIAYLVSLGKGEGLSNPSFLRGSTVSSTLLTQAVGLVPTTIVVRMGLGVSVEDTQTIILASEIHFEQDGDGSSCNVSECQADGFTTRYYILAAFSNSRLGRCHKSLFRSKKASLTWTRRRIYQLQLAPELHTTLGASYCLMIVLWWSELGLFLRNLPLVAGLLLSLMASLEDLQRLDGLALAFLLVPALAQEILYGIYATLFCQCMYIFRKRTLNGPKGLLIGTILLFILCTIQCAMNSAPRLTYPASYFNSFNNLVYVVTNLVADSMFVYRCYFIWGRKWAIVSVPLFLISAATGVGVFSAVFTGLPFGMNENFPFDLRLVLFLNLATNVTLTTLSAGRIWWISREVRRALGPKVSKKYNMTIALIVESGSLYCIAIVVYLISIREESPIIFNINGPDIASYTLFGVLNQIVGINPTLIVVRMGLGISVEDAQTIIMASEIQFERNGGDLPGPPDATRTSPSPSGVNVV